MTFSPLPLSHCTIRLAVSSTSMTVPRVPGGGVLRIFHPDQFDLGAFRVGCSDVLHRLSVRESQKITSFYCMCMLPLTGRGVVKTFP